MGRSPCCAKEGLNRGAWTPLEDRILIDYIKTHGEGKWRSLPKRAGLKRCGKSCRLRWLNYLRPDIKRGNITDDEEDLIIRLHRLLGNRWSLIAGRLPGRTDNEIKNYWNTNIVKKIQGGHASSSTKCKPPSKSPGLAGTVVQNSRTYQSTGPPNLENVGSCVVRTKARRCTKVFINADLRSTPQPGILALKAPSSADAAHDFIACTNGKSVEPEPLPSGVYASPTFSGEEGYSFGLMMDLEMDDKFLVDFLNTDFVTLERDFNEGVTQVTKTETNDEANDFSPNSCQNALLHDHSDLGSMASLLDPAMDWLREDEKLSS